MSQTENAPTLEQIAIFQALEEIDKDPCIGHLTLEEKDVLFDQFFSKEAKALCKNNLNNYPQGEIIKM